MRKMLFCLLFVAFVQISFGQSEMNMGKEFPCAPGVTGCWRTLSNPWQNYSNPNANLSVLRPVEFTRLQEVFREISKESGIEFNYTQAACQQRTQYISMLLTKKYNVDHFQVWLFAPADLDRNSTEKLKIADKNELANGKIEWGYHVAPAVKINSQIYVIDPSLDSENPMLLDKWLEPFKETKNSKYSFLDTKYYFFYTQYESPTSIVQLNVISGQFYTFEDQYQKGLFVEKGLAANDTAMAIYKKHIQPLQKSTNTDDQAKLLRLKNMFGNFTTLAKFLDSKPERNGEFQYFYNSDFDIALEAKRTYLERTLFWMRKTDELLK